MPAAAPSSTSQRIRRWHGYIRVAVTTGQTVQDRGFGELKVGEAQMSFWGLALMWGTRLLFHVPWPPCHRAIMLSSISSYFWLAGDPGTIPRGDAYRPHAIHTASGLVLSAHSS